MQEKCNIFSLNYKNCCTRNSSPYNVPFSFHSVFDSKKSRRGRSGYAKKKIDRNEIRGRNLPRSRCTYSCERLWCIDTAHDQAWYHVCTTLTPSAEIELISIAVHVRTYITHVATSRLRVLSHLHEIGYVTLIIQNLKPEMVHSAVCSLMEMQATDSAVCHIGILQSNNLVTGHPAGGLFPIYVTHYWFLWSVKFRKLVLNDINGD